MHSLTPIRAKLIVAIHLQDHIHDGIVIFMSLTTKTTKNMSHNIIYEIRMSLPHISNTHGM